MPIPRHHRPFVLLALLLLLVSGCGRSKPASQAPAQSDSPAQGVSSAQTSVYDATGSADQETDAGVSRTQRDERAIRESERDRSACFRLQPGATTTQVVKQKAPAKQAKAGKNAKSTPKKGTKTAAKATAKAPAATSTKVVRTTGRCQPQSLIYARCRTGIATCRLGDTSPVDWFACARKNGDTSPIPAPGSVIVLAANSGRGMPTGHPAYVEEARNNGDGTWILRITHTNYDRKCHLDQDAKVLYDPKRMTATFATGPWSSWAANLQVLGFILR